MRRFAKPLTIYLLASLAMGAVSIASDESFRILGIQTSQDPDLGDSCAISWYRMPSRSNIVEYADSLTSTWLTLTTTFTGTNAGPMQAVDYPPAGTTQRFYRVRIPRSSIVLSLVLDRSGSMVANGGNTYLATAVKTFIAYFDNTRDQAAMASFASHASVDVSMRQPFKADINDAVSTLTFNGVTCSEQGLLKGFQQNANVPVVPGNPLVKVIVFFTDGFANTFQYAFNCGVRNISDSRTLYNPTNGVVANTGCTVPASLPSIGGGSVNTLSMSAMVAEAELRAEAVADQARSDGNTIYCIGLGTNVNLPFLQLIANDPASGPSNPNQPIGSCLIATNAAQLQAVFQQIAQKALSLPY
jgi:hypothetical protein